MRHLPVLDEPPFPTRLPASPESLARSSYPGAHHRDCRPLSLMGVREKVAFSRRKSTEYVALAHSPRQHHHRHRITIGQDRTDTTADKTVQHLAVHDQSTSRPRRQDHFCAEAHPLRMASYSCRQNRSILVQEHAALRDKRLQHPPPPIPSVSCPKPSGGSFDGSPNSTSYSPPPHRWHQGHSWRVRLCKKAPLFGAHEKRLAFGTGVLSIRRRTLTCPFGYKARDNHDSCKANERRRGKRQRCKQKTGHRMLHALLDVS